MFFFILRIRYFYKSHGSINHYNDIGGIQSIHFINLYRNLLPQKSLYFQSLINLYSLFSLFCRS